MRLALPIRWLALGALSAVVVLILVGGASTSPFASAAPFNGHKKPKSSGHKKPKTTFGRDNAVRIWNFTSVPRNIDGTVYYPGVNSGVAHGDPAFISIEGCNKLEFRNPTIGLPWFRFTYGDQDNRLPQNTGGRFVSENGNVYFVSRHDDSSDYIEWEVEVLKC